MARVARHGTAAHAPGPPVRLRGLMAELLGGLALVMLAATTVLGAMLSMHHQGEQRDLLARALAAEALAAPRSLPLVPDTTWWQLGRDGVASVRQGPQVPIDEESRTLAEAARVAGAPLLRMGMPWGHVRFAQPMGADGQVSIARLPAASLPGGGAAPRLVGVAILAVDAAIFIAFGASLLRGRVVLPLRRLAEAARALADGAADVRAPVDGTRETAEVALAFNEMTDALAARSEELEKAVSGLRHANAELRDVQVGLARAERLAATGRLAAGVAHEVGNPMGALLALLDLAGRDGGLSEATRGHLARAGTQVERVRRILRQMLDFSQPRRHANVSFELGAVLDETVGLLRAQGERAATALTVQREGEVPLAQGDPGAAAQILLNLGLNALEAVRGRPNATVSFTLRTGALRVRGGEVSEAALARRVSDAVECAVRDSGPGVAEEDRERIFDPFFTTRAPGEGTGLGLSNAQRLAEELGGSLTLEETTVGACFVLRLPATDPASACGVRTAVRGQGPRSASVGEAEPQA